MPCKRIYLAAPYSHPEESVRLERFALVSKVANLLIREGNLVYSPITHGHTLGTFGDLPGDFEFWEQHCLSFLYHWAEELWVCTLPGWKESRGVRMEMRTAGRIGIPYIFVE